MGAYLDAFKGDRNAGNRDYPTPTFTIDLA
jgi:hypothetical protein